GRPVAHADAGDVRPPGLLPVRWCGELHLALHHCADDAPDVHIRLEPRWHPARDSDNLARHGRTRRGRITRTPDRPCSPWWVSRIRMTTMAVCSSINSMTGRYHKRCGHTARRSGGWERCISS